MGNSACGSAQVHFLTLSFTVISISDIIYKIKIGFIRAGVSNFLMPQIPKNNDPLEKKLFSKIKKAALFI